MFLRLSPIYNTYVLIRLCSHHFAEIKRIITIHLCLREAEQELLTGCGIKKIRCILIAEKCNITKAGDEVNVGFEELSQNPLQRKMKQISAQLFLTWPGLPKYLEDTKHWKAILADID